MVCTPLSNYSPFEGHLGCLQFLAVTNKAAINIYVQAFCVDISLHCSGINAQDCNCGVIQ